MLYPCVLHTESELWRSSTHWIRLVILSNLETLEDFWMTFSGVSNTKSELGRSSIVKVKKSQELLMVVNKVPNSL